MSRSTSAANKLEQAGFENIACIVSGLQSVKPGLEFNSTMILFILIFFFSVLVKEQVHSTCLLVLVGTFDSVGTAELKDAGKAGLVTVQGKISAILGTVLICKSGLHSFSKP